MATQTPPRASDPGVLLRDTPCILDGAPRELSLPHRRPPSLRLPSCCTVMKPKSLAKTMRQLSTPPAFTQHRILEEDPYVRHYWSHRSHWNRRRTSASFPWPESTRGRS